MSGIWVTQMLVMLADISLLKRLFEQTSARSA